MRELAILTFVTLDGVMQAPVDASEDQSGNFQCAGWARPYWDDVMAQVGKEAMATPYDLLLGRTTYENFERAHSVKDDGNADVKSPMDVAKKYVVTSSTKPLSWQNSHRISGDILAKIERLKSTDGPLLQIHGSWQLIQLLLAHDLIDEFRLWTFPVNLGEGKKLFAGNVSKNDLDLVKTEATGNGVVMNIYRRVSV